MSDATLARAQAGFQHEALLYADDDEFVAATGEFVAAGVAAGEAVMVALRPEGAMALRNELGSTADGVDFVDMTVLGANPARIIPAWRAFLDLATGRGKRGIGEPIWSGRSGVELVECQRHEALLNVAFGDDEPWRLLCPYNVTELAPGIIDEARRSHPLLRTHGEQQVSADVRGADMATAHLADPLPTPTGRIETLDFSATDVRDVRAFVAARLHDSGLEPARAFDLLVAASEVATNSLRHGGGRGTVRVWGDVGTIVCEFSDAGALTEPLVGRELPPQEAEGRRGLWLANQLCDLVQIRSYATGSVVRLHMRLDAVRPASAAGAY